MLVKDLIGAELDYWCAKAEGFSPEITNQCTIIPYEKHAERPCDGLQVILLDQSTMQKLGWHYDPSTYWAVGGPIIENKKIWISDEDDYWIASLPPHIDVDNGRELIQVGDTPLIAACRAYVASVFGDEVESIKED